MTDLVKLPLLVAKTLAEHDIEPSKHEAKKIAQAAVDAFKWAQDRGYGDAYYEMAECVAGAMGHDRDTDENGETGCDVCGLDGWWPCRASLAVAFAIQERLAEPKSQVTP